MKFLFKVFLGMLFLLLPFVLPFFAKNVFALPQNFVSQKIASGLSFPTDFALSPDGRIFITEQSGNVKILKNGSILASPFNTFTVDSNGERGLLSVAFDPNFQTNNFVYFSYIYNNPVELRVVRVTANGDQMVPNSEVVLLKSTQTLGLIHHSATIRFGPDGKLWITVGNNGIQANSQDLSNIHGKILRLNSDGSIPPDNPFFNQSGKIGAIWAYGLRNPFRFTFRPDGNPILGDVGDNTTEEVNVIYKGGNYGYPFFEGACDSCSYVNPIYTYAHNGLGAAIVGGVYYTGNQFPQVYKDSFFFGDYVQGFIDRLTFDSNGNVSGEASFEAQAGSVVGMQTDASGNLYYLTIFPGSLYKVNYGGGNEPPVVKIGAVPIQGDAPLQVTFSSSGTSDPNGDPLSYSWNFGDGSSSTEPNPVHLYQNKGKYQAVLTVSDGQLQTQSDPLVIVAGLQFPNASIDSPNGSFKYNAGMTINYSGNANDPQDGNLPDNAFSWTVIFHHNTHIHPFMPAKAGKSGSFVIPDTGESDPDTYYEIKLDVTNSLGLTTTVTRNIFPNKTNITLDTTPGGLSLTLDGAPVAAPYTFESVVGFKRTLDVPSPQLKGTESFEFGSWSDLGAKTHTISAPIQPTTYTASLRSAGTGSGNLKVRIAEFDSNGYSGRFLNDAKVKLTDTSGNTVFATQITSANANSEPGWASFDNITPGTYGLLAYKTGFDGVWKKIGCTNPSGSFVDASITNASTELFKAAWNNSVPIQAGVTTYCYDLGLQVNTNASLRFRVLNVDVNSSGYRVNGFIDGATVKLTDDDGDIVLKSATSATRSDGEVGWVTFDNIPGGLYGIMAYKPGYKGFLKKISCDIEDPANATITNANTEGLTAAWNNNVTAVAGKITYCYDLGLTANTLSSGSLSVRIAEFDSSNGFTGKYLNDFTVKLTDASGSAQVLSQTSATRSDGEPGWVSFDNVPGGTYGLMAYKNGYEGIWKKMGCSNPQGSFTDSSITNALSENNKAAWNNNVIVTPMTTTYCYDLGAKDPQKSSLRIRIVEFDGLNKYLGNFLNDVKVKLTDILGNDVKIINLSGKQFGNEDGWAFFDGLMPGTYGLMAYKSGYEGVWKKLDCTKPDGSFTDSTIQNPNTENLKAAWNNNISIQPGQVIFCNDLGLKAINAQIMPQTNFQSQQGSSSAEVKTTPIPTPAATPSPTPVPSSTSSPVPSPSVLPVSSPSSSPVPSSPAPDSTSSAVVK